jgi:hypothetical protein
MHVLIAIEMIVGVLFVMLFVVAEISRDLSQRSYHASPDGDDDDDDEDNDSVGAGAAGSTRPSSSTRQESSRAIHP